MLYHQLYTDQLYTASKNTETAKDKISNMTDWIITISFNPYIKSRIETTILPTILIENCGKKKLSIGVRIAIVARSRERGRCLRTINPINFHYAALRGLPCGCSIFMIYLSEQKSREREKAKESESESDRKKEREWERNCTRRRCLVLVCCETCICLLLHCIFLSFI